jgi:hypothetical protein
MNVYLLRMHKMNELPPNLLKLLSHKKLLKAGNYIYSSDVEYLRTDYGVEISRAQCIELNHLAKQKGKTITAKISLQKLSEIILGYTVPKPRGIRTCNWGSDLFSNAKQDYTARDAWSS